MKQFAFLLLGIFAISNLAAQRDTTALNTFRAEISAERAEIKAAQNRIDSLRKKIEELPGWRFGGVGILGINFKGSRWWFANEVRTSQSTGINVAISGFANNIQDKYFWRNSAQLNLGAVRFQPLDEAGNNIEPEQELRIVTDALQANSLVGYRFSKKFAISTLTELRTITVGNSLVEELPDSVRQTNFFNPAYLDLGLGLTWTPNDKLAVVLHPINQNYIFPRDQYESSLGAKVIVDYAQKLPLGIGWTSNFTGFLSYTERSPDLSNFTWVNSISFTMFKGFGVSAQLGLRQNAQESFNLGKLPEGENPLQTYYVVGLSYSI